MDDYFSQLRLQLAEESLIYLNAKVIPKAQKTQAVEILKGPEGEEIVKIKVAAVPEKGKANAELCRYLSKVFGVPKNAVIVSQGQTSQRKVIKVSLPLQ